MYGELFITENQFANSSLEFIGHAFVGWLKKQERETLNWMQILRQHAFVTSFQNYKKNTSQFDIWPLVTDSNYKKNQHQERIKWMLENQDKFPD